MPSAWGSAQSAVRLRWHRGPTDCSAVSSTSSSSDSPGIISDAISDPQSSSFPLFAFGLRSGLDGMCVNTLLQPSAAPRGSAATRGYNQMSEECQGAQAKAPLALAGGVVISLICERCNARDTGWWGKASRRSLFSMPKPSSRNPNPKH